MGYPENILKFLRKREGLEPQDTSQDEELNKLSPDKVFEKIVVWNGLLGDYDTIIKEWIKDIYRVDLENRGKGIRNIHCSNHRCIHYYEDSCQKSFEKNQLLYIEGCNSFEEGENSLYREGE